MKQVAITVKIDEDLKKDVQKLAKNMGLSFSAIVENKLREVRRDRRIEFEEEFIPNAKTAKMLDEAIEDIKLGRNLSPTFNTAEEAIDYLHKMSS